MHIIPKMQQFCLNSNPIFNFATYFMTNNLALYWTIFDIGIGKTVTDYCNIATEQTSYEMGPVFKVNGNYS